MWPILILGAVGAGVYYYATRSGAPIDRGPPDTKCKLNGEQFEAYIKKLDPTTGGLIMAAYNNPLAKKSALLALATQVRNLKATGFTEADQIADCIEVKADQATN